MLKSISNLLPHSSARFKFLYHSPSTTKSPCILRFLSTNPSPYPLQYELIINRPDLPKPHRRPPPNSSPSTSHSQPEFEPESQPETLNDWLDSKLTSESEPGSKLELDKSKRKYYNKRRKRMYGSDSDEDNRLRHEEQFVELKPQVVEFPTLHRREEELYFYDAFAYPWEKEKHYKMVYQLEKKYFPDQCLDKAFLQPGQSNPNPNPNPNSNSNSNSKSSSSNSKVKKEEKKVSVGGDNKLVFFEEKGEEEEKEKGKDDLTEKKVEEFFKGLKKVPNKDVEIGEPFFSSRRTGLPPIWDSPYGTVLLVNKPKGWTSFTVCGKLRRLVKVKKVLFHAAIIFKFTYHVADKINLQVGHAGTLDPLATGLLIVCVGKATKLVDRYQGMVKGYSGVFRLGEATSTWDADSPASLICRSFSVSRGSTSKTRT